jgi:poly-gamma-glutamate capsule biosynthesis protein CapA/YwtB (metallophosphatase superfamily)
MQIGRNSLSRTLLRTMDRRTLLGRGAATFGGLLAGLSLRPGGAYGRTKSQSGTQHGNDVWNVVVAGETMAVRPFSMHTEPEFLGVVNLLRGSDVTYAHLEMNFGDPEELLWAAKGAGRAGSAGGASSLSAPSRVAQDLKWAGIDMLSLAYNHAMDWGVAGMQSTIKACNRAGLVGAGTGMSLEEARGPAFCEKDKGRVALISASSPNSAPERAGLPKGSIPGRPGVNCIRMIYKYEVDHETAEQLRALGKKLNVLSTRNLPPQEFNIMPFNGESEFSFVDGNKFEVQTLGHPKDLEGNLRAIDEARQMADLVIFAYHMELTDGAGSAGRGDLPTKLAASLAKQAIDAGADIFVGHGWHKTLGIEIYKDKPIIYGTGNFFAQSPYVTRLPADQYEAFGLDVDKLTTYTPASRFMHPAMDDIWWSSAICKFVFENKKLTEIRLYPVELGWDLSKEKSTRSTRPVGSGDQPSPDGRPWLATGANAQGILERIQKLSAAYGTNIEIKDGIGISKISV